jgi:sporulation protein YlmC with PRC-barrel domain
MRLELGSQVDCTDGPFGKLADVVIDPTAKRLTHMVVEPHGEPWDARLVPVELAKPSDEARWAVMLQATVEEVRQLPPVEEVSFLRLDGFVAEDPDWDVGIQEVFALPYYTAYDPDPIPLDYAVNYDRIPKHEVEIRRASAVESADGHHLGNVDGFLVDHDDQITHLVLERGHLWDRRDVTIPIGAVARVDTDAVALELTKDQVGALRGAPVPRRPMPYESGSSPMRRHTSSGENSGVQYHESSSARFRRWLQALRRFWGPAPAPDHPLSERERNPMPGTKLEELTRDLKGIPGDTHLGEDVENH